MPPGNLGFYHTQGLPGQGLSTMHDKANQAPRLPTGLLIYITA